MEEKRVLGLEDGTAHIALHILFSRIILAKQSKNLSRS